MAGVDSTRIDLSAMLSTFGRRLLEEAESEVKSLGGELSLAHLAAVVARSYPSAATDLPDRQRLQEYVNQVREPQRDKLTSALSGIDSADDIAVLVDKLLGELAAATGPESISTPSSASVDHPAMDRFVAAPAVGGELPEWMKDFGHFVQGQVAIGRADLVERLIEQLGREVLPGTPLIIGRPGSGRTTVLTGLAHRLQTDSYGGPLAGGRVFRVNAHQLMSNGTARSLANMAQHLSRNDVLFIDDLEIAASFTQQGIDIGLLSGIRALMAGHAPRVVLAIDEDHVSQLGAMMREMDNELIHMQVDPLGPDDLTAIVSDAAGALEAAHHVTTPEDTITLSLGPSVGNARRVHPGLAIERLDIACVRCRLAGRDIVESTDLPDVQAAESGPVSAADLEAKLLSRVKGQDGAVRQVCQRLALTRSQLDLRPHRPDGVFLLVGPTGVGKTEFAKALADEVFGSDDALIRLDMSEYTHEWAQSSITGPPPGYVGSNNPAGWLTTKILARPDAVVLLDEFEKAHPQIWNTFLQVFDDGRLTDSLSRTVDFSRTVFVLTSNLGVRESSKPAVGFAAGGSEDQRFTERMVAAAKQEIAPELVNRLDDILVFRPLDMAAVAEITRLAVSRVLERYRARGYTLDVTDEVINHLASEGHSPQYGARHVHRVIESDLLQPLVGVSGVALEARLTDGTVTWVRTDPR